ncbi:DUF3841 domain-containing protein [Actinoplanes subglobosus]|uniref:DUF3841 domain-containing protein n=1 Tax=Actinoplanes subglobosus TaxID=1547892 RepID=A0ABV8J613_9ACTN
MVIPRITTVDTAVAPGRLACDIRHATLTLYSILSPQAWDTLAGDGILTGREDLIDPLFVASYRWIRRAAALRGLGDEWPVWLWARTTRRDLIDSVRFAAREKPGSVLITARIPRHRVLLSHFDAWHYVLNDWPAFEPTATDAEMDRIDSAIAEFTGWKPHEPKPPQLERIIEDTWDLIFDTTLWPPTNLWQATVPELRLGDVIDAVVAEPRRGSGNRRRIGPESYEAATLTPAEPNPAGRTGGMETVSGSAVTGPAGAA